VSIPFAATAPVTPALPGPVREIRALGGAELPFVLSSWCQSHMRSPGQPWGDLYRRHVAPTIERLLKREDVWIIGAFGQFKDDPDAVLGWLAWTPGDLPAVHYSYVRGALRKHGIFNALLRDAMVGRRMLVTSRGQLPKYTRRKGATYDKKVIDALTKRGIATHYVDLTEWLETKR
jgi:hypothetical protein